MAASETCIVGPVAGTQLCGESAARMMLGFAAGGSCNISTMPFETNPAYPNYGIAFDQPQGVVTLWMRFEEFGDLMRRAWYLNFGAPTGVTVYEVFDDSTLELLRRSGSGVAAARSKATNNVRSIYRSIGNAGNSGRLSDAISRLESLSRRLDSQRAADEPLQLEFPAGRHGRG